MSTQSVGEDIRQGRINKRQELLDQGIYPYGRVFKRTENIEQAKQNFEEDRKVKLAGRVMIVRGHGKTMFMDLRDGSSKIQLYLRKDVLGEEAMAQIKLVDSGDFLGVSGKLFKTRTGEETVFVESFEFLSKSLLPLPEKWHGLKDVETRYRQRYVDLVANLDVKERFVMRSKIVQAIRRFLDERDFLEVETPMMQSVAGGAAARPFVTHHNTLDMDLFLRIAPELYLKRLLVGGFEKVYEINRNFRNEGISPRHNPEFTMLELYSAYDNYEDMMNIAEEMIVHLAKQFLQDDMQVSIGDHVVDFSSPWKRMSMSEALLEYAKVDVNKDDLKAVAKKFHIAKSDKMSNEEIMAAIFEEVVEEKLINPTFVLDYPAILCPLCKTKQSDPLLSERFELFIGGQEVANAYSELNDPVEQKERFLTQAEAKEEGEEYSMDEDFVNALEHGMPPAGGLGIGIDRLVMMLTAASNIREVILFPQLRN